MTPVFKRFFIAHCMFLVFTTISSVFLNTFLMDKASFDIVLIYNIIYYMSVPLTMHFAPYIMSKLSMTALSKIGVIMHFVVYMLLAILMDKAVRYYYVFAFLIGGSGGFYWLSYNCLMDRITTDGNRDKLMGYITSGNAVITMLAPLLTGYFVSLFSDVGYFVTFLFSAITALITYILFAKMENYKYNVDAKFSSMIDGYRHIFKSQIWKTCLCGEFCKGFREGAMLFILNVALFDLVKDEFLVGVNSFTTGLAAVLGGFVIGILVNPSNRIKYMKITVTAMILVTIPLLFTQSPWIIVIYGAVNAFLQIFVLNSSLGIMFSVFESAGPKKLKAELFTIRELVLEVGRCFGVALFLILPQSPFWLAVGLMIITASQYLTIYFNNISTRQLAEL